MLRESGPANWANMTWYDGMETFAAGLAGMYPDCDFFAATYEDPKKSKIAGKVGYALLPAGPAAADRCLSSASEGPCSEVTTGPSPSRQRSCSQPSADGCPGRRKSEDFVMTTRRRRATPPWDGLKI